MKKRILTSLLTMLIIFAQVLTASADIYLEYSPDKKGLLFIPDEQIAAGQYFSVNVHRGEISSSNPPDVSWILAAKDNVSDPYFVSLLYLSPGKYSLTYGSATVGGAQRQADFIIYNLQSDSAAQLIEDMNNCNSAVEFVNLMNEGDNLLTMGIDKDGEESLNQKLEMSYYLKAHLQNSEFTPDTFVETYRYAKAVTTMKTASDKEYTMSIYADCFGAQYSDYQKLDPSVKSDVNTLIASLTGSDGFVTLNEIITVSKLKNTDSYVALRTLIGNNISFIGINTAAGTDYANISSENKYKVYYAVYNERASFKTFKDVIASFEKASKDVLKEQNDEKESNKPGKIPGSSASSGSSSSSVSIPVGNTGTTGGNITFSDIAGHYAYNSIMSLAGKGVISGYADGSFAPSRNVTRAEFSKMICLAFGIGSSQYTQAFSDVPASAWYYTYVMNLCERGIVQGYDGMFLPDSNITRQDAALIIYRVLSLNGKTLSGEYTFSDTTDISDYAKNAVSTMAAAGYLKGDGQNFRPQNLISRADTAIMIERTCTEVK